MLDSIRAFIAVNLEIGAIRRVNALQRSLRSSPEAPAGKVAWVAPPNLHITLRFLGNIDPALAPALADGIREHVSASPPIRIQLAGLEAYPRQEHARLLFVDVQDASGAFTEFAQRIEALAQSVGFQPETRPFRAHLTLGRLEEPADVTRWFASLGRSELAEAVVTECVLYHGEVERPGAEFTAIERVGFNAPPAVRSHRPRSRQPSHRPKARSKPPASTARARAADDIPPPPRLPNLSSDGEGGKDK